MKFIAKDDFLARVPRVRVRFELGVFVDGGTAGAGACGVTTLDDKVRVDAVEDCAGVVVVGAVLEEVAAGVGSLGGEKGDVQGTEGRMEDGGGGRVWFC